MWETSDNEHPLSGHCCAIPCWAMDQGSQFTGFEWINALKDADVKISMDGKGRWPPSCLMN